MTMPAYINPTYILEKEEFRVRKIDFVDPVPLHKHACYELFFIIKGEAQFNIDNESYCVNQPCLFLIYPNRVHGWEAIRELQGYVLKFDTSVFTDPSFLNRISAFQSDLITLEDRDKIMMIHNTFKALEDEHHTTLSFKDHTINSLLQILLVYIQRCVPVGAAPQTSQTLLLKLNDAIAQNNYKLVKPTLYAKKLNTSIRLLNKATSEVADQSLGQYIRNQTLQEAKRLLAFETMTCNEVAYSLGFSDPAYFSRFFKREVGVAPKTFRGEC